MQRITEIWPYSLKAAQSQYELTFCFSNFQNYCFNGFPLFFSAAILDRRYQLSMPMCNPIQSNKLKNTINQFEGIYKEIKGVRVPHLKKSIWPLWRHKTDFYKVWDIRFLINDFFSLKLTLWLQSWIHCLILI